MNRNNILLEARGIGRRLPGGSEWLLRNIWLEVRPGERIALAGASGSGKTLLLRSLALLDGLDAGEVFWQGQPVRDEAVPRFRRQVMYLHQRPVLFEGSVEANLQKPFTLGAHRIGQFNRERVVNMLMEVGRDSSFLGKSHDALSGGEAQIVALLRAIQLDPTALLLDEPTAALDPEATRSIEQLVDRWLDEARGARALLWVSHNLGQAERMAGRRITLREGQIESKSQDESLVH